MSSKSKPSELAVKAANLIDRNTEANGEYYVQEAIDEACAERDAKIIKLQARLECLRNLFVSVEPGERLCQSSTRVAQALLAKPL